MINVVRLTQGKGTWFRLRTAAAYVRHPRGHTCIDCGFLALRNEEMIKYNRVLLAVRGVAGLPDDTYLSHTSCFRSLWSPLPSDEVEVLDEVTKRRRPCEGFFRYRPGYSPLDHRGLLEKEQTRIEKIIVGISSAVGGALLALLAGWAKKRFGL